MIVQARIVFSLLCCLLLSGSLVYASHSTLRNDPFNINPDSNKSEFRTDSRIFWDHEDAQREGEITGPFVVSGGFHAISASLTSAAFATIAHVPERVSQTSTAITYVTTSNTNCWTIVSSDNNGITDWMRTGSGATGAYYHRCQTTQPTLPPHSAWLMQITTTGCPGACAIATVTEIGTRIITGTETVGVARSVGLGGLWIVRPGGQIVLNAALTFCGELSANKAQIFTGSSLVSFCANSKTSPLYPQWWGAVGDGVTESGAGFQKAFVAMGDGGRVSCTGGTFSLGSTGWAGVAATGKTSITFDGDCTINAAVAPSQTVHGVPTLFNISSSSFITVKDITIDAKGLVTNAIGLLSCTDSTVTHTVVKSTGFGSSALRGGGISTHLGSRNTISFNNVSGFWSGIHAGEGGSAYETDVTINNNTLHHIIVNALDFKGDGAKIFNNIITDMNVSPAAGIGVGIGLNSFPNRRSTNINVYGNTIRDTSQTGIEVGSVVNDTAGITGLTITDNEITNTAANGILAGNIIQGAFTKNRIRNSANAIAFSVFGTVQSYDIVVTDNIITDTRAGNARGNPGIVFNLVDQATVSVLADVLVARNIIRNMREDSIQFVRTSTASAINIRLDNNIIANSGRWGLLVYPGFRGMEVANNTFHDSGSEDIRLNTAVADDKLNHITHNIMPKGATENGVGAAVFFANATSVSDGGEYFWGVGSPEGIRAAHVGALYLNLTGAAGTTLYVKELGGSGNTGWAAK